MKLKIVILLAVIMLFIVSCTKATQDEIDENVPQDIPNEDTQEDELNNGSSNAILEGTEKKKNISVDEVVSILLFDVEGNSVDEEFSEDEITAIVNAYNESVIDDTSYIETITGYRMDILLENDDIIYITSYGDEDHIIATTKDNNYHLICPEIGKILLEEK